MSTKPEAEICGSSHNIMHTVTDKQKQLVDKYVELFNYAIDRNLGRSFTKFCGSLMENAVLKTVKENLEGICVNAEKGFVKHKDGKVSEHDIVIYKKGKENIELSENFSTLVVDSSDVVGIVEVKSFADSTGLEHFSKLLRECDLMEKGFFIGITGSIKGVEEGIDIHSKPKIFVLAKSSYANISKKQRMRRDKVRDNPGVLEQFLKILRDEVDKLV